MLVAGVERLGGPVEMIDVADPSRLSPDEVLIGVRAAGVANWDEIVRTGGWDVGGRPPMALGVEAAGVIKRVGSDVAGWSPGDEVMTHLVVVVDDVPRPERTDRQPAARRCGGDDFGTGERRQGHQHAPKGSKPGSPAAARSTGSSPASTK